MNTTVVNALSQTFSQFTQNFIKAHYLPALFWVSLNLFLLVPLFTKEPVLIIISNSSSPLSTPSQLPRPTSVTGQTVFTQALNTQTPATISSTKTVSTPLTIQTQANITTTKAISSGLIITLSSSIDSEGTFLNFGLLALFVAFALAIILVILNTPLIYLFEGRYKWIKEGILKFLTVKRRRQSQDYQKQLTELQENYQQTLTNLTRSDLSDKVRQYSERTRTDIEAKLGKLHQNIEQAQIPLETFRVLPTVFGNTYALAEEYASQRYGFDAVTLWPRLYPLMMDQAPPHIARLRTQKTNLDMCLNLTILTGLVAIQTLLLFFISNSSLTWPFLLISFLAFGLMGLFYYSSILAVRGLGEIIKISIDQYRHLLADAFGLAVPSDFKQESDLWRGLAFFIRWGEPHYFPNEFRKQEIHYRTVLMKGIKI